VAAIAGISQVISEINSFQASIASAVEQQSATTNGMTGELHSAAEGASQAHGGIEGVVASATKTRANAQTSSQAAQQIASLARELETAVSTFTY
jgi:methyl-accepting chemotaxis protein